MSKISILLTDGYADWEVAYNSAAGKTFLGIEIVTCSVDGRPVCSMGGFQTKVDGSVKEIQSDSIDILVLCGGTIWETGEAPNVSDYVTELLENGKTVAGVCGATLALARCGALDTRQHVSNSLEYLKTNCCEYVGESQYVEKEGAVVDQDLITAPGNAPISFTANVFAAAGVDETAITTLTNMFSLEHR